MSEERLGWIVFGLVMAALVLLIMYLLVVRVVANSECEDRGGIPVPRSSICLDPDSLR